MKESSDNFERWQAITIQQLTFTTNLVLAMSTASLGFSINLLNSPLFILTCAARVFFDSGGLLLVVSIVLGVILSLNRLKDFRMTAQIARDNDSSDEADLNPLREKTRKLGENSWSMFHWQIGLFAVGIVLLIISIASAFRDKLF